MLADLLGRGEDGGGERKKETSGDSGQSWRIRVPDDGVGGMDGSFSCL
jgi:hypothetical protein